VEEKGNPGLGQSVQIVDELLEHMGLVDHTEGQRLRDFDYPDRSSESVRFVLELVA
jgi:hypothetical protein